jgi:hypothetical protein
MEPRSPSSNAELEPVRVYYPKLDAEVDHGEFDLVLETKALLLMSHDVVFPPGHLTASRERVSQLLMTPEFIELVELRSETGGILTSIYEDHRDTYDFLHDSRNYSPLNQNLLSRFQFRHRNPVAQSRLFRSTFETGLRRSEILQRQLLQLVGSVRVVDQILDELDAMRRGAKIALSREGLRRWAERTVAPEVRMLLLRYGSYCYYLAGAVGNSASVVPSKFFLTAERPLWHGDGFYSPHPAYDPELFLAFLEGLGVERATIRALPPETLVRIRESRAHELFRWWYYRLAEKVAADPLSAVELLRRDYRRCDERLRDTLDKHFKLLRVGVALGATGSAVFGRKALSCILAALSALTIYAERLWRGPLRPKAVGSLMELLYGAIGPMSLLVDRLRVVQSKSPD